MRQLDADSLKRNELDKWAESKGVPALPINLQLLSPEKIEQLFNLYLDTRGSTEQEFFGGIDYAESDRRKLEAVRWAVGNGNITEERKGSEIRRQTHWEERFSRMTRRSENIKPKIVKLIRSQLDMRGR